MNQCENCGVKVSSVISQMQGTITQAHERNLKLTKENDRLKQVLTRLEDVEQFFKKRNVEP